MTLYRLDGTLRDMNSPSTTDRILRATSEIVSNHGVRSLTLDAVARQAGVSKGGLLYHFPTKHALLRSLVLRELDEFETEIESRAAGLEAGPGRRLRASVEAAFDPSQSYGPEFLAAMIGVFAEDPTLLEEFAARYRGWQQMFADDVEDGTVAAVVSLALDGLFLADLMGLGPAQGAEREALRKAMSDLAGGRLQRNVPAAAADAPGSAVE